MRILTLLFACQQSVPEESHINHIHWDHDEQNDNKPGDVGGYGDMPYLTLPFPSGNYWAITRTYQDATHTDYGGSYSDDSYAVDFGRGNCDAYGKPVTPVASGTVYSISLDDGSNTGYGNTVLVEHEDGFFSRYAHLSEIYVKVGDTLSNQDYLGAVGDTGSTSGNDCDGHVGVHLHLALYKDGKGVRPEPLSGNMDLTVGCWYNREGDRSCDGDPGSYDDENEIDDEGELSIARLDISPEIGTAEETHYIWSAIIVSPDYEPSATLSIYNEEDMNVYEFKMETKSTESPWVFTYRKTLRDPAVYTYWVDATNGDGNDKSDVQSLRVDPAVGTELTVDSLGWTTNGGENTQWYAQGYAEGTPAVHLNVVNTTDGVIYSFPMGMDYQDNFWSAEFSKDLRDSKVYTFWVTAEDDTSDTSQVGSVDATE